MTGFPSAAANEREQTLKLKHRAVPGPSDCMYAFPWASTSPVYRQTGNPEDLLGSPSIPNRMISAARRVTQGW